MAELNVDGQKFKVTERPDEPGAYDFFCLGGPHGGLGFTVTSWDGSSSTVLELEDDARQWLADLEVDPD